MTLVLLALALGCAPADPPAGGSSPDTTAEKTATQKTATQKTAAPASRDVVVSDAWVRVMPPGSTTTAAFMKLHNQGTAATAVVAAASDAAETVELHTHIQQDGVAKMRQVERFDLAVDQAHELAPAGDHIMLIGLYQDLVLDQSITLDLRFADGSEQQVRALVKQQPLPAQR